MAFRHHCSPIRRLVGFAGPFDFARRSVRQLMLLRRTARCQSVADSNFFKFFKTCILHFPIYQIKMFTMAIKSNKCKTFALLNVFILQTYALLVTFDGFPVFEIRKNLDLRKILSTPKIFLISRFHCTDKNTFFNDLDYNLTLGNIFVKVKNPPGGATVTKQSKQILQLSYLHY